MNTVLTFLTRNWQRLSLEQFGKPSNLATVALTPRFRASSHVIFFVLADGKRDPILVAKLPRLLGDNDRLDREVTNLHAAQRARATGFDSIPRVVAYEDYCDHRILIETALVGGPMNPLQVRRQTKRCLEATLAWLIDLDLATANRCSDDDGWFARLAGNPLKQFKSVLPRSPEEDRLIDQTYELTVPYREQPIPLVLEHGDLSHPNIILTGKNSIGVVDWELAEPRGLPATDLFFFLTYIAFARRGARKNTDYLAAFHKAFFGQRAWARPYIVRYIEQMKLPPEMLTPLFVLCWSRYVIGLVLRLYDFAGSHRLLDNETIKWVRANRYYALWRHTIAHLRELRLTS
jgi:aminoglycoside phosphotransferase